MPSPTLTPSAPPFLQGGDSFGALLRTFDWAATPVGRPEGWPQPLKTVVGILLASNQPMFVAWGPQRTLIYNEPYTAILADKHPQALGRDFLEVWSEIRDDIVPMVTQAYRGQPVQMDDIGLVMRRRGYPEVAHFSFFYSPVHDEQGRVAGLFCACNETTSQVLAQRRLRESEARHRGVLDHMDEGFVLMDQEFRLLEINDAGLRMDSRPREQLIGQSHWVLFPGTEHNTVGRMYMQCMQDGLPRSVEHLHEWPDGRRSWYEVRANRTPEGLSVFYRDVTARRDLAEAAAQSTERLQLALDAGAIVGTWVWDADADLFVGDARFARTFGLDEARVREGLTLAEVTTTIHPDDLPRVSEAITAVFSRGGPYRCEYRVRQQDGVYRWIEANGHLESTVPGQRRFPGVLLDIGERRRAEAERDRANALLRTILEAVPGVVYAKDLDGRMLVANRGAAALIGKPPEDFLDKTDLEFLDDKVQARAVMATDRRIMDGGQSEQVEELVRLADGSPAIWLSTKAPMRDADGYVIGLIGASVDITERKRNEEAVRESDHRKSEFLAVLSHELRNPLAPIRNGLHLLERAPAGSPVAARAIEVIRRQSDHLARLVDDLLDMTRISRGKIELQRERIELRAVLREAATDAQSQLADAGIHMELELGRVPLWVDADPTRVSQVVGNLLNNAIKFTPAQGTITLALGAEAGDAVLRIRDTGAGMEPDEVDAMFEPFVQGAQTLARTRGGLGLGLPLVRGLVEMHGGRVSGSSPGLGHGAEFVVRLPLADAPAMTPGDPDAARASGGRRILIIEDNEDAAETLAQLLEMEGHSATIAGDGASGLAQARLIVPDLVLCDIGLPDMDGFALARALRAEPSLAGIRLVALSGYAQPEDRRRSVAAGFDDHMAKPPDIDQLLALVGAA